MLHTGGRRPGSGILVVRTDMEALVRVALAQIITGRDLAANLELVEEYARRAKDGGAELVVFPEASMRAFGNSLIDIAEPLDGPWANRVRSIAAGLGIVTVAGMFTPGASSSGGQAKVRNTLLVTGPGVKPATTRFTSLMPSASSNRTPWTPGQDL